jgi:hypothetical protein
MESSLPKVIILMPLRDDWAASAELIRRIDRSISSAAFCVEVLLVDDGSQICERSVFPSSLSTVRSIWILRLRRNVGRQRAIAIGLMHIKKTISSDAAKISRFARANCIDRKSLAASTIDAKHCANQFLGSVDGASLTSFGPMLPV